jgi:hypothetical protein
VIAVGVLHRPGILENAQYSALRWIRQLSQKIARSFGHGESPAGLW